MRDGKRGVRVQILVLMAVVFVAIGPLPTARAAEVTVVFRWDDYSARSDTAAETRLIETFRCRRLPLVVGVIPCLGATGLDEGDVLPPDKADLLRRGAEDGTLDVALHGYSHVKTGWWTEFAGLDFEEQLRRLKRGRDLLREAAGVEVTTFIPPYNTYDHLTLRAMEQLGFTCLCAGKDGPTADTTLAMLPSTCGFTHVRRTIESARNGSEPAIVVVLFHLWDITDATVSRDFIGWTGLEELLDWVSTLEGVTVSSIRQILHGDTDLSVQRFAANRWLSRTPGFVPGFLLRLFATETGAYLSTSEARHLRTLKHGLYVATAAFYAGSVLTGAAAATFLRRKVKRPVRLLLQTGGIILLGAIIVYSCRDLTLGYHSALLISVGAGSCLGLSAPLRRRLKIPAS